VPEDVWYVVPIAVFGAIRAMKFFPSSKRRMSRYEKYREAWCLMACPRDGKCRTEVEVEQCCQRAEGGGKAACPKAP
jgi:hypothetical protein